MKKSIIYLMFIVFTVVSCSKNNSKIAMSETNNEDPAYCDLMSNLENYNSEYNIVTKAGGFWRRLGRVALADCVGYLGGVGFSASPVAGFFFGAFSSIIAVIIEITNTRSGYLNVDLSKELLYSPITLDNLEDCDYVGEVHNQIIDEIYSENPECFELFTEEMWIAAIREKISEMYLLDQVVDITPWVNDAHDINDIIMAPENSLDDAFDVIKTRMPERINELEVVLVYCKSLNAIEDNQGVINYTQGFREIVVESNINSDSKQFIQSAISVAGNSQLLWSECLE